MIPFPLASTNAVLGSSYSGNPAKKAAIYCASPISICPLLVTSQNFGMIILYYNIKYTLKF